MIHGVEGYDALHVRRRELEQLRNFRHGIFAHPAAIVLDHPERRQQRRHLRWIARQQLLELLPACTDEHRLVRLVGMTMMRGIRRRFDAPHFTTHLSISPMTMSMLALIAITSDSRWPSTIFGIADKFTNEGGRIRHRTGFDV